MLQLTASEVESLPKETKVYEGVGKMYDNRIYKPQLFQSDSR